MRAAEYYINRIVIFLYFFRSIFWKTKYMEHNFSILTDRKSKNAPATQELYLYLSMIWQNSCYVKTWNNSFLKQNKILDFDWKIKFKSLTSQPPCLLAWAKALHKWAKIFARASPFRQSPGNDVSELLFSLFYSTSSSPFPLLHQKVFL